MTLYARNKEYVDEERERINRLARDNTRKYVSRMGETITQASADQQTLATDGMDNLINQFMVEIGKMFNIVNSTEVSQQNMHPDVTRLVVMFNSIVTGYRQIKNGQFKALVESKILSLQPYVNDLETIMSNVINREVQFYYSQKSSNEPDLNDEDVNKYLKSKQKGIDPLTLTQFYSSYSLISEIRDRLTNKNFAPIGITDTNYYFNSRIKKDFGKVPDFIVDANVMMIGEKKDLKFRRFIQSIEEDRGVKMSDGELINYAMNVYGQNLIKPIFSSYLSTYLSNDDIQKKVDTELLEKVNSMPQPPPQTVANLEGDNARLKHMYAQQKKRVMEILDQYRNADPTTLSDAQKSEMERATQFLRQIEQMESSI